MSAVLPQSPDLGGARAAEARAAASVASAANAASPSPADRLAASRMRLRAALLEIAHPPPKPSVLEGLGLGRYKTLLTDKIQSLPGADLILATLEEWWSDHPLRTAGVMAGQASKKIIEPVARGNPAALIAGSVVLGALFALSRPWRWLLRPALFMGLVPNLIAQVLKRAPVESWVHMATSLAGARSPAGRKKATARPEQAPDLPTTP